MEGDTKEVKLPPPKYKWGEIKENEIKSYTMPSGRKNDLMVYEDISVGINLTKIGVFPDFRESMPLIREMPIRDDDVLICAYPKAGTHWLWEITKMLKKGKAEYDLLPKETAMLEFHFPSEFDSMPSPRVFNTHLPFNRLPKQLIEKKCKLIFIQRNPKDVAVSAFNHTKTFVPIGGPSFDDYIRTFRLSAMFTNWYGYTLDWEKVLEENKNLNIHMIYYEDLKQDPIKEIKKLAAFLDVKADETLIQEISDRCNFAKMKSADRNKKSFLDDDGEHTKKLLNALYRKGQIGDWKNWFTVSQNEQFDAEYGELMKYSKLKFTFV